MPELDWNVERDGRMADHADYFPVETWPEGRPRPVIDADGHVTDADPIIAPRWQA